MIRRGVFFHPPFLVTRTGNCDYAIRYKSPFCFTSALFFLVQTSYLFERFNGSQGSLVCKLSPVREHADMLVRDRGPVTSVLDGVIS